MENFLVEIQLNTAMENLKLVLILVSLLNFMPELHSEPDPLELRFYVHDVFSGDNQTVYLVAQPSIIDQAPLQFGRVFVLDNVVTYDPEIESEQLGRLQGTAVLSDLNEIGLHMLLNLVITQGKYNGSTLNIYGRNPLLEEVREVSIVGGTGAFRMARGYVTITTYSVEVVDIHLVYEYRAIVYNNSRVGDLYSL